MFKITDAEKLRDAYTLLAFIRDTTTAEQKSGMAAFIASIKKEIRDYNNRPAPDSRIIEEHARIEVIKDINKTHLVEYFKQMVQHCDGCIEQLTWNFGENYQSVKDYQRDKTFYESVVARLEA